MRRSILPVMLLLATSASSAELPSRRSAPRGDEQVCAIYGAGFVRMAGTDTCVKVGGRVRVEYAVSPTQARR